MTESRVLELLSALEEESFTLQPLWANFEKMIVLIPEEMREDALNQIKTAFQHELCMFRVSVAERFLKQLSTSATPCKTANDVAAVPIGEPFLYVGAQLYCPGLSYPYRDEDRDKRSHMKVGTIPGGVQSTGFARLSHSLVSSVDSLRDSGNKFLYGVKTGDLSFIPLIAGARYFSLEKLPAIQGEAFGRLSSAQISAISPRKFADMVINFLRTQIESGRTWKLISRRGGKETSQEADFQLVFELVCRVLGPQYDISVDPQANHGAGNLDVCLSRGSDNACCIELKMSASNDLKDGMEKQLPAYLKAKGIEAGVYVVCCTEDGLSPEQVRETLGEPPIGIAIVTIDARPRPSASNL